MSAPTDLDPETLRYQAGFGNSFASEALPGALPRDRNSPKAPPYGLYAEQLNGMPFMTQRAQNTRVWLYRIRPALIDAPFTPLAHDGFVANPSSLPADPTPMRWEAPAVPAGEVDFVDGWRTIGGAGAPGVSGFTVASYACTSAMARRAFVDTDGDLVLLPYRGALTIRTELGPLHIAPGEIALIRRGIAFAVTPLARVSMGWVLECAEGPLRLPERGPLGANGLADERHFLAPTAAYLDDDADWRVTQKLGGRVFEATRRGAPFDVVAWHGRHVPVKYDLRHFNAMGSVTFDHPDPSSLTVLTCPKDELGRSAADIAVFRGRWDVAEDTYRPPYFHRNAATEFNGVIQTDDPEGTGEWTPGDCMHTPLLSAHGISTRGDALAREAADTPQRLSDDSLWIQVESSYPMGLTPWARDGAHRDARYLARWGGFPKRFDGA